MPYKSVVTFLLGTKELYDYAHENPSVVLLPVEKVTHPMVIAQNDKMVAINSALQVDLYGQVNAETIGTLQFSGVGGQVDFVRGATLSKGGEISHSAAVNCCQRHGFTYCALPGLWFGCNHLPL